MYLGVVGVGCEGYFGGGECGGVVLFVYDGGEVVGGEC